MTPDESQGPEDEPRAASGDTPKTATEWMAAGFGMILGIAAILALLEACDMVGG